MTSGNAQHMHPSLLTVTQLRNRLNAKTTIRIHSILEGATGIRPPRYPTHALASSSRLVAPQLTTLSCYYVFTEGQ